MVLLGVAAASFACGALRPRLRTSVPMPDPNLEVSYRLHIKPIFLRNCDCHDEMRRTKNIDFTHYKSSRFRRLVVPHKPEESILYLRLTGAILPREPYQRDPLLRNEMELIRMWIEQGAPNN